MRFRRLEINGGRVEENPYWQLILPPITAGYADAQIDDYGLGSINRSHFPWLPGTIMRLRARFTCAHESFLGTAGFGFWNAPFGDPTIRWPALPQAAWFFFASPPTNLPLALEGAGQGWFAATIDASGPSTMALFPLAPAILILNQSSALRKKIWPVIRRQLKISFAPIISSMEHWHQYELSWMPDGCSFLVDGAIAHHTPFSPTGPLGFVCWVDNQFLIATSRGRVAWGTLATKNEQLLEVDELTIGR